MKLALMQPTFNPWLGYFDLIDYVDELIFFDTVQLAQQSWQTRNKIKIQNNEFMVSIPIKKNQSTSESRIKDALIDSRKFDFRKKLIRTIEQNYNRANYFDQINSFVIDLISFDTEYLSKYNINIIQNISKKLEFNTKFRVLSEENYIPRLSKGEQVLDICKYFNAAEYISPLGSKEYLDKIRDNFSKNNISISYQHYAHPIYTQTGDEFIPYLGIFDLLYNEGFEKSKEIIRKGRKYEDT